MKAPKLLLTLSLTLCLSGCFLIPKQVELGQKKVKPIPEKTESHKELERQAADYVDKKVDEAYSAALQTDASTNVIKPLGDAHSVAPVLSSSLGPPEKPYQGNSTNLAQKIEKKEHDLTASIDKAREKQEPLVGKKIEGTGFIQMNYFVAAGGTLLFLWLIWQGVKIYGMINPAVGIGVNTARIPAKLLSRKFAELIEGGEKFKQMLEQRIEDPATVEKLKEWFAEAHLTMQSRDTQETVKDLTRK